MQHNPRYKTITDEQFKHYIRVLNKVKFTLDECETITSIFTDCDYRFYQWSSKYKSYHGSSNFEQSVSVVIYTPEIIIDIVKLDDDWFVCEVDAITNDDYKSYYLCDEFESLIDCISNYQL